MALHVVINLVFCPMDAEVSRPSVLANMLPEKVRQLGVEKTHTIRHWVRKLICCARSLHEHSFGIAVGELGGHCVHCL